MKNATSRNIIGKNPKSVEFLWLDQRRRLSKNKNYGKLWLDQYLNNETDLLEKKSKTNHVRRKIALLCFLARAINMDSYANRPNHLLHPRRHTPIDTPIDA